MNEHEQNIVQDCNINFLIGAGLSCPYLTSLGNIEKLLTEIEDAKLTDDSKALIRASIYQAFFDGVISKNLNILADAPAAREVQKQYVRFLEIWNYVLLRRNSPILGKEINLFTTNVDIFLEKALEESPDMYKLRRSQNSWSLIT